MVAPPINKPRPPAQSRRQRAYLMMALAEEKAGVMSGLVQRIDTGAQDQHGPLNSSGICVTLKSDQNTLHYTYWYKELGQDRVTVFEQDWASVRDLLTKLIDHASYTPTEPQPWQVEALRRAELRECHQDAHKAVTYEDERDTSRDSFRIGRP